MSIGLSSSPCFDLLPCVRLVVALSLFLLSFCAVCCGDSRYLVSDVDTCTFVALFSTCFATVEDRSTPYGSADGLLDLFPLVRAKKKRAGKF